MNMHVPTRVIVEELQRFEQDFHILELAKQYAAEATFQGEYIDFDTLMTSCHRVRNDVERKGVNCFISYVNGEPTGLLLGVTSPCFHRPMVVAEQKLWYVKPDKRGSMSAGFLIQAFERWARTNGATQIFTGSANSDLSEKTSKYLIKLGYARVGALHMKEIAT